MTDEEPLLGGCNREIGLTAWRWYMISVFALLAMLQSMTWNIYAPISQQLRLAYGPDTWTDLFITWAENTGNVAFLSALPVACWAFDRVGARTLTVVSAALLVTSTGLRVLPLEGTALEYTVIVSMVFNGVSGTFVNFGAPILSQLWFCVSERTVATAIGAVAPYFGSALGFLVGPYVVGQPTDRPSALACLRRLYYIQFFSTVLVLVLVVLYFPDKPKRPPSQTAANSVSSGTPGNAAKEWMLLLGHADSATVLRAWVLTLCLALPLGVYQSFGAVLDLNLGQPPLSLNEKQAGYLGAMMTIIGCLGSVLVGFVMDRFARRLKSMILVLMLSAALGFVTFAVDVHEALSMGSAVAVPLAYGTAIVAGFAFNSTIPLFFELIMETTFGFMTPSAACSFVVFVNTIVQIAFLCVPTQIDGSAEWMNWTVAIVMCVFGALLLSFRPKYLRLDLDAVAGSAGEAHEQYSGCI